MARDPWADDPAETTDYPKIDPWSAFAVQVPGDPSYTEAGPRDNGGPGAEDDVPGSGNPPRRPVKYGTGAACRVRSVQRGGGQPAEGYHPLSGRTGNYYTVRGPARQVQAAANGRS